MKETRFLLILFIISINSYAQNTYILNGIGEIHEIEADNTLSLITTVNYPNSIITDIAVSPSGIFYGIKNNGELFEINIQDGSITILPYSFPSGPSYVGLVCSNNNILYTLNYNGGLYKYNIDTGVGEYITNPGFSTPGDLTFYRGNLIFQASNTNFIKAYNIENDNVTNIFCLPENTSLYGVTCVFNSCDEARVIGGQFAGGYIYELDMNSNEVIDLGIELYGNATYGMASISENQASTCNFQFTDVDCSLSINESNWYSTKKIAYPNTVENNLYIDTNLNQFSIVIYNLQGQKIKEIKTLDKMISVIELKAGIYFIEITSEFGVKIEKIIKK